MPAALNVFLRKELNLWTQSETKWIDHQSWRACGQPIAVEALRGRACFGGLDLSSNTDLSAFVLVFPPDDPNGLYQALCRFWIPLDNVHKRVHDDRVPYDAWIREGYITPTPGNVIDYDFILAQIDRDAQAFDIKEVAFDRWGASRIQTQLMELGGPEWLVQFGQGFVSMSPPMKELERLLLSGRLAHGNHPVLTWMASNLVAVQDAAGNLKPDKEKSRERIDGMVALIMGLDRALRHGNAPRSVYEKRGLRMV